MSEYIDECMLPWKQGADSDGHKGLFLSLEFDFGLGQREDEEGEDLGCFPGKGDSDSKSTGFQKRELKKAHLLQWHFDDILVFVPRLLVVNESSYSY